MASTRGSSPDLTPGFDLKRARRVLRREAVLASLEQLELIERTRGGLPLRAVKEDTVS